MAIITTSAKLTASSEPSSGVTEGQIYYNSTTKVAYIWNGTLWKALNAAPQADLNASGGILSTALSGYKIHIFLLAHTGNTWTPTVSGDIDYLVVSGGGGGGDANSNSGGGGGGGGFLTGSGLAVQANVALTISVGAGGVAGTNVRGVSGGDSSIASLITTQGGGGGGAQSVQENGRNGGSGGGATWDNGTGGSGNSPSTTPSQGYNGGNVDGHSANNAAAGGGGGAGGVGGNATQATTGGGIGNGGIGEDEIMGLNAAASYALLEAIEYGEEVSGARYFAGGGAGEAYENGSGTGGYGGGGDAATVGLANTGGGGGGGSNGGVNRTAQNGGSGIVLIRYPV